MIYSKCKSIAIRSIEKSDLDLVHKWRNSECLRQYFREYRELSMTQIENWYYSMLKDNKFEMFIIVDCDTEDLGIEKFEPIGVAGITDIDWVNRHGDVHLYIGKDNAWIEDKYSKEVADIILNYGFNNLNLNKLWAEVYEIDEEKLNFFQSLGFKIDASLREHYYRDGVYYTSHILSLLRRDYA